MTYEDALEIIEAASEESFDARLYKKRLVHGIHILAHYYGDDLDFAAEHDVLYVGGAGYESLKLEEWDVEDLKEMGKMGWSIDRLTESWIHYC